MPGSVVGSHRGRHQLGSVCAVFAVVLPLVVLVGWAADIALLKSVLPGLATMKANTALSFLLLGLSLWTLTDSRVWASRVGITCSLLAIGIAGLTLAQYILGWKLGIDQILIADRSGAEFPGRMAPATAIGFLILGPTLLLLHGGRAVLLAQGLTGLALLHSAICCLGYLYGVEAFYAVPPFSSVSLPTAVTFLVLSVGTLAASPARGPLGMMLGDSYAGMMVRRLLPAAIVLPILFGWLRLQGQKAGLYGTEFGLGIFALSNVVVFSTLVFVTAVRVERAEALRKRADESLQESERRFRLAVESSPFGIIMVGRNGQITLTNGPLDEMFGYAAGELLGLSVESLIPERYRGQHPAQRERYLADPRARAMGVGRDLWGVRKDGSEFPVEVGLRPLTSQNELDILVSVIDISTRKEAEQALRQSEQRIRLLLEGVPQLVWTCASDGHCDYLSRQWIEYTGIPEAEQLGYGWSECVHPDDRPGLMERWQQSVRKEMPLDVDFRIRSATGEYRWFKTRAVLYPQQDGSTKWLGTNTDIHDKKLIENQLRALNATLENRVEERTKALQQSEQRFRAIFNLQFQFIGLMSLDGIVLEANRTALAATGASPEEVLGKPFWETRWWQHDPAQQERLRQAVTTAASGKQVRFEATHPTAVGSVMWVDFSLTPFRDDSGTVVLLIPEGRDITERKRVEEQLRASLHEKEVLLREIHHRVKNNLQIVSALLDLQSGYSNDPQTLAMFKESRSRVRSMAMIHERLYRSLDLARVDFGDYIRQLADDLYRAYKLSEEDIILDVAVEIPPLPIDIAIPCGLLINELISNAFKHGFNGVSAGRLQVALQRYNENLNLLRVADTGVGFPQEIDFRNTRSFGLQLVNTLVEQLHGTLALKSVGGTEFSILFPVTQ